MKYRISRYWNKFAYIFLDIAKFLVWDITDRNKDILGDDFASYDTRDIMTTLPKRKKQ